MLARPLLLLLGSFIFDYCIVFHPLILSSNCISVSSRSYSPWHPRHKIQFHVIAGNTQVEPLNGSDIDLGDRWIQAALPRLSWVRSESFKQRQMDWSFDNRSNPPSRDIKLQVPEGVRKAPRSIHISCCSTAEHGLADIMEPGGVQSGSACACVSVNLFIWWWVKYALPLSKIMLIQVLWGTEAELIYKHEWFAFSYIWSLLHKSYMWIYHIKRLQL